MHTSRKSSIRILPASSAKGRAAVLAALAVFALAAALASLRFGSQSLSLADRATVANMAPEYGATMGYFPVDDATLEYLRLTGRDEKLVALARDYFKAQGIFGIPSEGDCDYTKTLHLDLADVRPSIAGPKRPQDKIELPDVKESFQKLLSGLGKSPSAKVKTTKGEICDGSVLIAAITSCTNTSNPSVLVAAGLVAKKADELGIAMVFTGMRHFKH